MSYWKAVDLFTADLDITAIQTSSDSYQFVIVDGVNGQPARRVFIDASGTIIAEQIGVAAPVALPSVTAIKMSEDDDEGTAIPKGSIIQLCYTYVNEQEEESNPSPVLAVDTAQIFSKGSWLLDGTSYNHPVDGATYVADADLHGSWETITVDIPISGSRTKRVNVYLAHVPYSESSAALTSFLRVASELVLGDDTTKTVTIISPQSSLIATYDNDPAPSGDDIVLIDGATFVANAKSRMGLTNKVSRLWAITIKNSNSQNYVNRFHKIDLYDETAYRPENAPCLTGLDWDADAIDMSLFRIYDTDLTTPLEVYHYPKDSVVEKGTAVTETTDAEPGILDIGDIENDNVIRFSYPGAASADVSIQIKPATMALSMICGTDIETELIFYDNSADHKPLSIEYVDPSLPSQALDVTLTESNKCIHVSLATDGTGAITTTVAELYAAIEAAIDTANEPLDILDGYISGIDKGANAKNSKVLTAVSRTYFTTPTTTAEVLASTLVKIYPAYDSETEAVTGTALDVVAAANGLVIAGHQLSAEILPMPGYGHGIVEYMASAENLTAGSNGGTVTDTNIATRLMSFIRIPYMMAQSEKVIYLAELYDATDIIRPFVELVLAGASTGQMNLTDFYRNIVTPHPVRDEMDYIVTIPKTIPYIGTNSDGPNYDNRSLLSNRANTAYYHVDNYGVVAGQDADKFLHIPDEFARKNAGSVAGLNALEIVTSGADYIDFPADIYASTQEGTLFFETHLKNALLPAAPTTLWGRMRMMHLKFSDSRRIGIYYDPTYKVLVIALIKHSTEDNWTDTITVLVPLGTDSTPTNAVGIFMSWKQIVVGEDDDESEFELSVQIGNQDFYKSQTFSGLRFLIQTGTMEVIARIQKHIDSIGEDNCYYHYASNAWINSYGPNRTYVFNYPSLIMMRAERMEIDRDVFERYLGFMPYYPSAALGAYNEYDLADDNATLYYRNSNVSMESYILDYQSSTGRIQWGAYGAMPDLNEYPLNEEVMRMAPLKSFQPTDEHNTVIIVTRENLYRLALLGASAESCVAIKELSHVGMYNRNALCVIRDGIAWLSQQGLMLLTASGIKPVSYGQIAITEDATLIYDSYRHWLWVLETATTFVYQLDERMWWQYSQAQRPEDFIGDLDGDQGWICYADTIIYEHGATKSSGATCTKITTKAYPVALKLGRIKLLASVFTGTYKYLIRLFGAWITGGTSASSQYTASYNKMTSAPNAKSDYFQIELEEVDNVFAILTEDAKVK